MKYICQRIPESNIFFPRIPADIPPSSMDFYIGVGLRHKEPFRGPIHLDLEIWVFAVEGNGDVGNP